MIRTSHPNKKLTEIIQHLGKEKTISVELNPYKTIDYNILTRINPSFCSVTWIANRNDPKNPRLLPPIMVAKDLIRKGYVVLVHIPGIFYTRDRMRNILLVLKEIGVRNIFAMRGGGPWLKIDHCDFPFAQDFIEFISSEFGNYFEIVIAGFPHIHPATGSMENEMFFLRQKVEAGASLIFTQACMSPQRYLNYRRICTEYAIDIPIIFGLLMFRSYNDFVRVKRMCCFIDKSVYRAALQAKRSRQSKQHGRKWTNYLIRELLKSDLTVGVHIFTQNFFELANNILIESEANKCKADLKKRRKPSSVPFSNYTSTSSS
ncbi:methylenetetrahydrofolate reductase-like [Coccinella septempunctata]|uniref:methylenetetrahydrofolate reductase-like n=1 Tax=Coccinella septempunctata TaxID=41139 RepID=UPI001D06E946|nr:methylenetetrahydrofolate reductase-like [Coccinella septempunctata]